jgi:hypothetical protein
MVAWQVSTAGPLNEPILIVQVFLSIHQQGVRPSFTVRIERPSSIEMIPPSSLVRSSGMGAIDLPLRAFSQFPIHFHG